MYLSAIHLNYDNISARQAILENLIDEELGDDNHPELWLRFGEGMGRSRESMVQTKTMEETQELLDIFMRLTRDQRTHIGMAALYCYESMVPEIAENKIDGLKKFYGIDDQNTLKFFTVHLHADKWHRKVIRNLISELCDSSMKQEEALAAIDEALYALNNFLTGMEQAHC